MSRAAPELGYGSEAAFELELLIALPQGLDSSPLVRDRDGMPIAPQPFAAEGSLAPLALASHCQRVSA